MRAMIAPAMATAAVAAMPHRMTTRVASAAR